MTEKRLIENERFFSILLGFPLGEYSHSHEEVYELFLLNKKLLSSEKSLPNGNGRRKFYARWKKVLGREVEFIESSVFLRAYLLEKMDWNEIAWLSQRSVSGVRSQARRCLFSLIEAWQDQPMASESRECALLDLHILEYLRGDVWNDPLSLYTRDDLRKHSGTCERCQKVMETAEAISAELKTESERVTQKIVSRNIASTTAVDSSQGSNESEAREEFSTPWSWTRVSIQGLGFAVLVGAVLLIAPKHAQIKQGLSELSESALRLIPVEQWAQTESEFEPEIETEIAPQFEQGAEQEQPVAALDPGQQEQAISEEEPEFEPPSEPLVWLSSADPLPKTEAEMKTDTGNAKEVASDSNSRQKSAAQQKASNRQKEDSGSKAVETTRVFFRWGARAEDPDRVALKVLEMMNRITVKNVSEFSLGADYKGGKYFHFTVSTDNYSGLLSEIRSLPLTDFTYSQSKGSREVPADQSRVVLWIGPSR